MGKFLIYVILFFTSSISLGAEFVAGKDYEIIKVNQSVNEIKGRVLVTEFFSFGCPWCYKIQEPFLNWVNQNQAKVYLKEVPVVFHKDWEYYAKAYYAAKALNISKTVGPALFKAIINDKLQLNSDKSMMEFFVKHGVNDDTAKSAFYHSPSIDLSVKSGILLMSSNHINAVPAFVVNNQFKTDLQMAKTEKRLFEILDFLVAEAKKESLNNLPS